MNTKTLLVISLLASTLALPAASADDVCSTLPSREAQNACYQTTGGVSTEGCDGENAYGQADACAAQTCPVSNSRVAIDGCGGYLCKQVQSGNARNCLEVICQDVPPTFVFVQTTLVGAAGLLPLGAVPQSLVIVRVLKNAGISCEQGSGGPGSGSGCQRVLSTPVGGVGADPDAVVNLNGETGTECSWAQSGVAGYNYVSTRGTEVVLLAGGCSIDARIGVQIGGSGETYRVYDSCTP